MAAKSNSELKRSRAVIGQFPALPILWFSLFRNHFFFLSLNTKSEKKEE